MDEELYEQAAGYVEANGLEAVEEQFPGSVEVFRTVLHNEINEPREEGSVEEDFFENLVVRLQAVAFMAGVLTGSEQAMEGVTTVPISPEEVTAIIQSLIGSGTGVLRVVVRE